MRLNIGEKTIEQLRAEKLAALRAEKLNARDQGVLVNGILFDTDAPARTAYLELSMKLAQNPAYTVNDWKASEGCWVEMNAEVFAALQAAGEAKLTAIFSWVRQKEEEIATAGSKAAVRAITTTF